MADDEVANLYLWFGNPGNAPELKDNRIILFSTWGFSPPLKGPLLQRAVVNVVVQAVAVLILEEEPQETARGTIGFFNPERDVAQVAGSLRLGNRNQLDAVTKKKDLPASLTGSLESLLDLLPVPNGV